MKRLGLWITFYAAMMMLASAVSYRAGFLNGYNLAAGQSTVTLSAMKVICHGAAACGELENN